MSQKRRVSGSHHNTAATTLGTKPGICPGDRSTRLPEHNDGNIENFGLLAVLWTNVYLKITVGGYTEAVRGPY